VLLQGGLALIGDYGHWGEKEDTFRGFRRHEVVEPLSDPGNIDVTADVDFEELVSRVLGKHNIEFFGPLCQRDFLYNLGIDVRATALAKNKTPEEQDDILGAVEKLVSPEYMGERFKYLCAKAMRSQRPPAGFSYSNCLFQMPGHFVNEISNCVDESLIGYVRAHSHLELVGRAVIARCQTPKIAVISGGGSGHEPAMVGYVGRGMLTATVCGSIFASPPSSDIFRTIVELRRRGAESILLIILNYTGDRLNFGLAMERARELNIDIDMLVVADDAAVDHAIGPRGLCGTLLVIKVAGALAEKGASMSEIVDFCQRVRGQLRTIGLSASGIRAPGQSQAFELADDEMELGLGIHGESGVQKLKLLPSRQAVDIAFGQLIRGTRSLDVERDDNVFLLVNNLGGCSNLELGIILKDAIENLEHRGLHVKRVLCGEMMSSFNMKGFSLTILKLADDIMPSVFELLDFPTDAYAWPKTVSDEDESQLTLDQSQAELVNQALQGVVKRLHNEEDTLNKMDAVSGDGDTGTAFSRAADAINCDLANNKLVVSRPSSFFRRLGLIAEAKMGGTSGAICGLFFAAASKYISAAGHQGKTIEIIADAFESGIQSVESYARVQPGDKSLLDALMPAIDFIKSKSTQDVFTAQDWKDLALTAEKAADDTKTLIAKVGRAAYAKGGVDVNVADPGAAAVALIIQAVSDTYVKAI
ncbi:unnamed protein product, partial [Didymodactylos carnosus]